MVAALVVVPGLVGRPVLAARIPVPLLTTVLVARIAFFSKLPCNQIINQKIMPPMAGTQQRHALAIRTVYPLGDGQHFATNADRTYSTPSLVDLAHVTHSCPTGLMAYPRMHGMEVIKKKKKKKKKNPITARLIYLDMTERFSRKI